MSDKQDKQSVTDRVQHLFGGDPTKESLGGKVLNEALEELKAERAKEAKSRTKEQLSKLIDLETQKNSAERDFKGKMAKFDKEARKILGKLNAQANGTEPPEEEDDDYEEANR